jgi:hypothetical protein
MTKKEAFPGGFLREGRQLYGSGVKGFVRR